MKIRDLYKKFNNPSEKIRVKSYSPSLHKFAIEYGWGANILISIGDDGVLLVDSGYRRMKNHLKNEIIKLTNKEIRCIINSHPHGDHIGGNSLLSSNGQIIVHKNAVSQYSNNSRIISFNEEYTFWFNNEKIQLFALPFGHTNSDIIVYFAIANIVYMGDLYLTESFPLTGKSPEITAYTLVKNLERARDMFRPDT